MSQDPLKKRLARIREKGISQYKKMGFHVYPVNHAPFDFLAFRAANGAIMEIRRVRTADGPITDADEKMMKHQPRLSSLFVNEVCCWIDGEFITKTIK